jgi:hypothetical protein
MRNVLTFGFGLVLVGGLSGCGGSGGAESTFKEMISAINEMAQVYESIKDEASADAALPRLQKAAARYRESANKMKAIKVTKSEDDRLEKQFKPELDKARTKLQQAIMNAALKAPKKAQEIIAALAKVQI